jgi:exoribonuclease R
VHRWLWAVESRPDQAAVELKAADLLEDMNATAQHCSMQAEIAEMTEHTIFDLKVCQYMEKHIGQKLKAQVLRVMPPGMEVKLLDHNITAFLPSRAIGDKVEIKGPTMTIRAGRKALSFTEGHPIAVRVKDVDFVRLQVMLELA